MLRVMDDARLAGVLRSLRVRRGWRQLDLADAAHVSRGLISLL
jgi:transcriptional regulator with XRE-family HTH domain